MIEAFYIYSEKDLKKLALEMRSIAAKMPLSDKDKDFNLDLVKKYVEIGLTRLVILSDEEGKIQIPLTITMSLDESVWHLSFGILKGSEHVKPSDKISYVIAKAFLGENFKEVIHEDLSKKIRHFGAKLECN